MPISYVSLGKPLYAPTYFAGSGQWGLLTTSQLFPSLLTSQTDIYTLSHNSLATNIPCPATQWGASCLTTATARRHGQVDREQVPHRSSSLSLFPILILISSLLNRIHLTVFLLIYQTCYSISCTPFILSKKRPPTKTNGYSTFK